MSTGWRGCNNIICIGHGEWSDPDLVLSKDSTNYVFNYWDIENALWESFLEETGHTDNESDNPHVEIEFDIYCQRNAEGYMEDCIYGGYFKEGSTDWHDNMKERVG